MQIKALILSFLLLVSTSAHAKREFLVGGLTYHNTNANNVADRFENKVSSDGRLILNPTLGVGSTTDYGDGLYSRHLGFIGQNSIGQGMAGYVYEEGGTFSPNISGGIAIGGYLQARKAFLERRITPFAIGRLTDSVDLVPIAGITAGFGLSPGVKLNLLLTPVICNLSISLELK